MKQQPRERAIILGEYILEQQATVRAAAEWFGISKSTVHKDVSERLPNLDPHLYAGVKMILEKNKQERHIRGGLATRKNMLCWHSRENSKNTHTSAIRQQKCLYAGIPTYRHNYKETAAGLCTSAPFLCLPVQSYDRQNLWQSGSSLLGELPLFDCISAITVPRPLRCVPLLLYCMQKRQKCNKVNSANQSQLILQNT